jgi:hypothetical protein
MEQWTGWMDGWKPMCVNCGAIRGKKLENEGEWLMDQRETLGFGNKVQWFGGLKCDYGSIFTFFFA